MASSLLLNGTGAATVAAPVGCGTQLPDDLRQLAMRAGGINDCWHVFGDLLLSLESLHPALLGMYLALTIRTFLFHLCCHAEIADTELHNMENWASTYLVSRQFMIISKT